MYIYIISWNHVLQLKVVIIEHKIKWAWVHASSTVDECVINMRKLQMHLCVSHSERGHAISIPIFHPLQVRKLEFVMTTGR